MNKLDFLRRLDRHLAVLDREERKAILAFYEERFYTGTIYENKTEAEVIAELESPESIARNVLEEYGVSPTFVKKKEERYTNISVAQVIFLITFDVLVATWLIPALFSVAVSIFGSVLTYFGSFSLLMGDISTIDEFTFAFITAAYILLFMLGLFVLNISIYVVKQIVIWHLNVFKLKNRDKWIKRLRKVNMEGWFKRHKRANRLKTLLVVASLVTIGYTGFWIFNNWDAVQAEYGAGEVQDEAFVEDLSTEILNGDEWDIVTDFGRMEVEIVQTSGTDLNILHSYVDDDEFEYTLDTENNILTLTSKKTYTEIVWDIRDLFSVFTTQYKVRIEVPADLVLNDANINNVTGEVTVRNVNFNNLLVDVTTGSVDILNLVVTEDLTILSTTGSLNITNITVGDSILAEATSGSIDVDNVELGNDLTINITTGHLSVSDINVSGSGSFSADATTGDINVENVNFANYLFEATTGRVELDNLNVENQDGVSIIVDVTTGSINMENVYVDDIELSAVTGSINFYNDDTDFLPSRYERDTTTGSINTNVR